MNNLLLILVALCGAEFVHNNIEIWGMRQKVSWLGLVQKGQMHGKWPINVDTKLKTVGLHASILILFGGLFYLILRTLKLSDHNLVVTGIVILLINYACTTWCVDIYHNQIGQLIKKAKKAL